MAKFKAVLNTKKSKKNNDHFELMIRVQHSRKKKEEIHLKEYLPKLDDFDKIKGEVKARKHIEHERLNNLIRNKIVELESINPAKKDVSYNGDEILTEFERKIINLEKEGKENSRRLFFNVKNHIVNTLNENGKPLKLRLEDIDDIFLDDFKAHLLSKGLAISTIKSYMDKITTVFSNVNSRRTHLIYNPIRVYKSKMKDVKKKISFNSRTFVNFRKYLPKSKERIHYKNWNIFQYYSQGQRISDIITIRWDFMTISNMNIGDILKNNVPKKEAKKKIVRLEFNSIKTGEEQRFNLCIDAILALRFFIETDLQEEYLNELPFDDDELEQYVTGIRKYTTIGAVLNKKERAELLIPYLEKQKARTPKKCIFHNVYTEKMTHGEIRKLIVNKSTCVCKCQLANEKDEDYLAIDHLSSHSFRHLFSIDYFQQSKNIYSLSKLLFHTNIGTTERYLAKLDVQMIEDDVQEFYESHLD